MTKKLRQKTTNRNRENDVTAINIRESTHPRTVSEVRKRAASKGVLVTHEAVSIINEAIGLPPPTRKNAKKPM